MTAKKATTSEETGRALEQRREEARRGRETLSRIDTERTAAQSAYAEEMTTFNRGKLDELDAKVRDAQTTLDALETRERVATQAHAATVQAEQRAELATLEAEPHPFNARGDAWIDFVTKVDRAIFDRYAEEREAFRQYNERVDRAHALAEALNVRTTMALADRDDLRVLGAVAIAGVRARELRVDTGCELALTPIVGPFYWENGQRFQSDIVDATQFAAAEQFLNARKA